MFDHGHIRMSTTPIHTVHALDVDLPKGRLTAVTGVSGSGKTTVILESLVPALTAVAAGKKLPSHVTSIDPAGIGSVAVVDAAPIGLNVRSTVATYSGVLDEVRRAYAATPDAKERGLKAGDFSYNTGSLRCPDCDGTGQISLDVQFLPDVDIVCPGCEGARYNTAAHGILRTVRHAAGEQREALSLPAVLRLTVEQALTELADLEKVHNRLRVLADLGLGYLTLGEATTALSGGEAQRLELSADIDRDQHDTLFVLDEPSIGLHPLDVHTLLRVLERLIVRGATVVIIEHDLDMIRNADYVVDLGPGGAPLGGTSPPRERRTRSTRTPTALRADISDVRRLREADCGFADCGFTVSDDRAGHVDPPTNETCPAIRRGKFLYSGYVELRGLEPLTPTLPVWCATSCAIAPYPFSARRGQPRALKESYTIALAANKSPGRRGNGGRHPAGASHRAANRKVRRSSSRCRGHR